jgi:prepilin-type N-terminal cleavage/methylation domain-containing protein
MNKKQLKFNSHCPNFQKGLTLIEMLVAVAMFAITVIAVSGLFISSIRSQQRILASQELSDQTSYVLEYISRALRMAKKQTAELVAAHPELADCLSSNGLNYEQITNGIRFIDHENNCTEFYLDTTDPTVRQIKKGSLVLTSSFLKVNHFDIYLSGQSNVQPMVTLFLEIQGREAYGSRPEIKIQTSISQRDLNIQQ